MGLSASHRRSRWAVYVCGPDWFAQFSPGGLHEIPDNTRWAYSMDKTVKEPVLITENHDLVLQVKALLDQTDPVTGKFVQVSVQPLERSAWMDHKESLGEKPFKMDGFYPNGCVNGANEYIPHVALSVDALAHFLGFSESLVVQVDKPKSE